MNSNDCEIFLENVLELGKKYIATGVEVKRIEESIRQICTAYGFEYAEKYAVTSLIVATIKAPDGRHYTQSVRVTGGGTDLGRLEDFNAQIRYICENTPNINELSKTVNDYEPPKPKPILKCIGYMLAAGGFAVFFGGSIIDGLASAVIAIAIYIMDYRFKLRNINNVVYIFIASFASGTLAILITHLGFGDNLDKVMIGDIMLFIPGLLTVNAVKEMLNRDIVTGLYRLIEAVFTAVAIAGDFALAVLIIEGAVK
ncbi:MAG: threonine/serine exporter family protein [Clostridiales bacterium]|nr:threonine/serine exporter family protein [Clostridiales bacterium]